jgi:hypothetical protein
MVNTFLVHSNFRKSAEQLDSRRLGKQRVEAYQILNLIENIRILSAQSEIFCRDNFQEFVREVKKWYQKQTFVYILCDNKYLFQIDKDQEKETKLEENERWIKMGFCNHPAVEMWFGYEDALKEYIDSHIEEWITRGYKNNMKRYKVNPKNYPEWCSMEEIHINHMGALINKELDRNEKAWYQKKDDFLSCKDLYVDYIWVKNKIVYE